MFGGGTTGRATGWPWTTNFGGEAYPPLPSIPGWIRVCCGNSLVCVYWWHLALVGVRMAF